MFFEQAIYNWSEYTILIVEDDVSSTFYLKEVLKDTGALLLHAPNGLVAVEICKTTHPVHVVLMDIKMPVMNGYDATRAIKLMNPKIAVIAQTANTVYETRLQCREAGCDDFITKPIDSAELLYKINNFLVNLT